MLRLGMAALAVFLISSSAPVLTDALAQDSSSDRDVLVTLYHATDGPNWENNDSWLSSAPIGEWYGVVTNADGRVSELNMFDNRLNGKIPPELGGLSSLDWLYLGDNQLSGKIPPELGNLANLEVLVLDENRLSGEIPPELGNLANLEMLVLDENRLSGEIPPELGSLSSLEWLELNSNQLSGEIPPELGNLSNLIWLELSNNLLTGCIPESLRNSQVNDLPNLGLPFCSVEGPRPTPSLTSASTLATEEAYARGHSETGKVWVNANTRGGCPTDYRRNGDTQAHAHVNANAYTRDGERLLFQLQSHSDSPGNGEAF